MKSRIKLSLFLAVLFICTNVTASFAQTKEDIISGKADITWLGLDFSQVKFKDSISTTPPSPGLPSKVTNDDFKNKYIIGWNQIFTTEQKKYDIAKNIGYDKPISYDLDITYQANNKLTRDFFTTSNSDYKTITESKIAELVKKYDFQGKTGVGLIVFVDGMSKDRIEAGAWVTFVNMGTKKVLLTAYRTGKPEGFGLKNYLARAFLNIVKDSNPADMK